MAERRGWHGLGAWIWLVACGPTVELETDGTSSGSGAAPTDTVDSASADETGTPQPPLCGEGGTGLFGGGPPGFTGFPPPCRPVSDPGINGYRCCSDDPAASEGLLPAFQGLGIDGGTPYFAELGNDLSHWGQCIRIGDLQGQGLQADGVSGCPIPCNPTWPQDSVDTVCGAGRVCCQTVELQPEDCIMDLVTGLFRPVTGDDIGAGPGLSQWRPADHATHQDPNGSACIGLADGDPSSPVFQDCVRRLTVANQRGFCMALGPGQVCPTADPSYVDACEALNGG